MTLSRYGRLMTVTLPSGYPMVLYTLTLNVRLTSPFGGGIPILLITGPRRVANPVRLCSGDSHMFVM